MTSLNHLFNQRPGLPALFIALFLVLVASLRIVSTYRVLSHTTDEPAHLAAGIEWIENGTYTYEDQHPPLARVAGALGVYVSGSRWSRNKSMYDEGYHLLGQNKRYNRALFFSRLFMLPFFWVGAAAVWCWGLRVGGSGPALLATLLFTTTPPILAHAGLATTDMALTAFVSATLVASLYWAEKPGWRRSVLFGAALGLALLSKFSALAFLPATWLLMYAFHLLFDWRGVLPELRKVRALIPWTALSAVTAAFLVWAGYRFDVGLVKYLNAILPAPAFFTGIRYVFLHNREGHMAYLLGQRNQTGFWYYYPVVLAVKTPLATLILMLAAVWFAVSARAATRGARGIGNSNPSRVARPARALFPESARAATRGAGGIGSNPSRVARPVRALFPEGARAATRGAERRCDRLPIAMPLALVAAVLGIGLFSHINIGVRHILPIYTGFAICGGAVLNRLFRTKHAWLTGAAAVVLLWQIMTGVRVHPDYIAYTNELAGNHPERILADSDLDWDQGMRGLALRLQQLGVQKLTFKLNSSGYMIANGHSFPPYDLMPDGDRPQPGWNAVCVTAWKLSGEPKWAARTEPAERIHRSIYLYYFPP